MIMTKSVCDRILKDANSDISDHLRNHIHLTNCIHLKNHMHKNSPSLIRDLVLLRRTPSLRDPSMSPPRFQSPSPKRDTNPVRRRHKREESSIKSSGSGLIRNKGDSALEAENVVRDIYPGSLETRRRNGKKTLSQQLNDVQIDSDDAASSRNRSAVSGVNRVKRRGFRGGRRVSRASRDGGGGGAAAQNETSMASNFVAQNVPRNGCGIPWNWSRIHDRGRSFLSCGLSDPKSKRNEQMPVATSDRSTSSTNHESLPLLIDGSRESTENLSGELGIFANDLLNPEIDSDLASEARYGDSRHQSLTQKYAPRTFRDLVGQNLAVQALSNAVARKKVGLLYVFYGPHGTGKTSCARIFARALTCRSPDHPKPCGYCKSCLAHDRGTNRSVTEVGPVGNLENALVSRPTTQRYKVFIVDDCDTLTHERWGAVWRAIDRAPRRVVFVLVNSSLDALPHTVVSRCHKFFFPKLKDADIIYTLQWISTREDFEIDKDALKLIASRSDGSLRDAEMTLEQLSLLGRRISLPLVQELVGLISDEKLVDLLDLALSADTVNTVKNLREIMESGVEPLALMSQLATVITDILAGSYDFSKGKSKRKFFHRHALSKDDTEKLRRALKTLSEAEKQLRTSSDKSTWLTAALLQLAPDHQYMLPGSSADTSTRSGHLENSRKRNGVSRELRGKFAQEIEEIWLEVLDNIQTDSLKEFLYQEGKLASVSFGAAPTVRLVFSSHVTKSRAEKLETHILQAFERVLGSPVTVEFRCESRRDEIVEVEMGSPQGPKHEEGSRVSLERRLAEQSRSLVRGKVSLANVIQQQQGGRSTRRAAVSIAERLEQENLRLEARSRSLWCWKGSRVDNRKGSRLKARRRRAGGLWRLVSCGKCVSSRSPRL